MRRIPLLLTLLLMASPAAASPIVLFTWSGGIGFGPSTQAADRVQYYLGVTPSDAACSLCFDGDIADGATTTRDLFASDNAAIANLIAALTNGVDNTLFFSTRVTYNGLTYGGGGGNDEFALLHGHDFPGLVIDNLQTRITRNGGDVRFAVDIIGDSSFAPIPEPGTLALMGVGAGVAAWRRRRSRRHQKTAVLTS